MPERTTWNLQLLYDSEKDTQIEKDMQKLEKACESFAKKYAGKKFLAPPKLAIALKEYEALTRILDAEKPWWYFALRKSTNSKDELAHAKSTAFSQRSTVAQNKIRFFTLEIAKIQPQLQKKFLTHPALQKYRYFLERIFISAKYNLTEKEEQLRSLLSETSYSMWVSAQEKNLNNQTIQFKGKTIPLGAASSMLSELPTKDRRSLQELISAKYESISPFAEAEINAVYNYKKVMDERRGFKSAYSATILGYENDEQNIEKFVQLVTKNFSISKRFYTLHAKLLKEKKLKYADRAAKIGKPEKKV